MSLQLKDDLGRTITLPHPARRIVTLGPDATENLFAIGAGAFVVGVSTADSYPPQVKLLLKVGDWSQPVAERIRALKPDIVIAASGTIAAGLPDQLQARFGGIPVFAQKATKYDDITRHLLQLGQMTGHDAAARKLSAFMTAKSAQIAKQVAGKPRVSVFVEISASPLYAAGPGSFVDDLIRRAVGTNVVTGNNPFPMFSKEALIALNPEHYIIAVGGDMNSAANAQPAALPVALAQRLRAVRSGNVHRIPADLLFRATPRLADGLGLMAKALHG